MPPSQAVLDRDDPWVRALARAITEMAELQDTTHARLCRRAGIHPSRLSRCLRGERVMTVPELARVAEALGLPPASLLLRAQNHLPRSDRPGD